MNIEKLVQYLDNKLPLNEESLSELNQLVEEHPYFQTAHMLLLKTLLNVKKDLYSKQLQKSVCYISDKNKLFHFVKLDLPNTKVEKPAPSVPDSEKPKKIEKRQVNAIADKLPTKPDSQAEKEEVQTTKSKPSDLFSKPSEVFSNLSDEEIDKLHFDNSNQRHGTIVGDFFNDAKRKSVSIKSDDKPKNEPKSSLSQPVSAKKDNPITKTVDKEPALKSSIRHESVEIQNPKNVAKPIVEKSEPKIKVVKTTQQTDSKPVEREVLVREKRKIDLAPPVKKDESEGESKKMNDIFSKIKKIKKEISVNEQGKSGVIDLNEKDKKVVTQVKPKDNPKPKLVIKESFVGGDSEEEKIKESELTAKDLFNKHKQRVAETNKASNDIKESVVVAQKPEDKPKTSIVETKEEIKPESKPKPKEEVKAEVPKSEPEKVEKVENRTQELTAAEKLLQRIEARKKQRELDKIEEEKKKELLKQKERDAIDEIIKNTPKKEVIFNDDNKSIDTKENQKIAEEEKVEKKGSKLEKETVTSKDVEEHPIKKDIEKDNPNDEDKITSEDSKNDESFDDGEENQDEKTDLIKEMKDEIKKEKEANLNKTISKNTTTSNVISDDLQTEKEPSETELKKDIKEPNSDESSDNIKKGANDLIDSFIAKSESLERIGKKESSLKGDISVSSTSESEDYMTETYAELLAQQKKYAKAKEVYEKLILKYPEKKTYFAIQIKKVERFIK